MSPTPSEPQPSLGHCRELQAGLIELLGYPIRSVALPLPAVTGQWQAQDWREASSIASTQGVISWFLHRAAAYGSGCPVALLDELGRRFQGARVLAGFAANMSLHLGREFGKRSIPMRVFKGQFLAQAAYGDARLRNSSDIDIIVPPDAVADAAKCLIECGFRTNIAHEWFSDKHFLARFREVPFTSVEGLISIDFHWRLASRWTPCAVDDSELYDDVATNMLNIFETRVPWFSPSVLWRIQLTHMVSSDWLGFKTWLDLAHTFDLLNAESTAHVVERCVKTRCSFPLAVAALVLRQTFGRDTTGLTRQMPAVTLQHAEAAAQLCIRALLSATAKLDGADRRRLWRASAALPAWKSLLLRSIQHDLMQYQQPPAGHSQLMLSAKAIQQRIHKFAPFFR